MFQFEIRGALAVIAIAMCFALAVVLYRTGARGTMARRLSLLLVIEGFTLATSSALWYFLVDPDAFFAQFPWFRPYLQSPLHSVGDCGMLVLYPPFLAAALKIPMTRPFARRQVQLGLLALGVVLFPLAEFAPEKIGGTALYMSLALLFGFALVAAISAWRSATSQIERSRARIFVLAFGFRDLCWGFIYIYAMTNFWIGFDPTPSAEKQNLLYFAYVLGTLVAVPMIAYGILKTQLFDIDLKIRWTIKQSTLAAVIIAFVYIISEAASEFLSAELGKIAGILAAAVVVVFLAPLQRFADKVASAAMPGTKNTPEYIAFRKMQVYESAVSEALAEGGISHKERTLLNHLRESLGISAEDAQAIESELQTGCDPGQLSSAAS